MIITLLTCSYRQWDAIWLLGGPPKVLFFGLTGKKKRWHHCSLPQPAVIQVFPTTAFWLSLIEVIDKNTWRALGWWRLHNGFATSKTHKSNKRKMPSFQRNATKIRGTELAGGRRLLLWRNTGCLGTFLVLVHCSSVDDIEKFRKSKGRMIGYPNTELIHII